jgi:hypothetical protein
MIINMKQNKYNYYLVIQQNYGHGWEDNSHYIAKSDGTPIEKTDKYRETKWGTKIPISLFAHDLAEYKATGYSTRYIFRKELNNQLN